MVDHRPLKLQWFITKLYAFPWLFIESLLPLSQRQILDSSKVPEFADDNLKFHENGRMFSKHVESTVEKRKNCSLRAISHFPTVFSKTCTAEM